MSPKKFDIVYFKYINVLLDIYIYKGYHTNK